MQSSQNSSTTIMHNIQEKLFALKDEKYKKLQASIVPNIDPDSIIGVRVPDIRRLAKSLDEREREEFIASLPHQYYDENMLHGAILSDLKDFDAAIIHLEKFLKYVDNWAVCDLINPKAFAKNPERLLPEIMRWIRSGEPYTVRFGIGMLMRYFLDERFGEEYLSLVAAINIDHYYVKMMQAWYFATALAKQYENTLKIIEFRELDPWVHNKSIQKACDSYRVPLEHKNRLKALKSRPD